MKKTDIFKQVLAATLLLLVTIPSWCADGDTFTASTTEGVSMTFKVISESEKTCMVGNGTTGGLAISTSYDGAITIPSSANGYSVTTIGGSAFYGCYSLTSVTIPSSVTSIGHDAFYNCTGLTSIAIPSSVTSIGKTAFSGCSGLTSATISSSVKSIGDYTFMNCTGLTSIAIPSSVTSIGKNAFSGCSSLTSVTIPSSVTNIGDEAFAGCSGLTSVTIPSSVTSIGEAAFYECTGLTSVTIPSSVTSIGVGAFYYCTGLTSATISSGVTSIGEAAFYECSGLTSVTIPSSVTSIGAYAFYNCTGLTSVTIPSNVTSIGEAAFYECSGLTSVTVKNGTPVTITGTTFSNSANATLYVPASSKVEYEAATNWKEFKKIGIFLDEESATDPASLSGVDVNVIRTIYAGEWNTICLPFAMSAEQVEAAFGSDVQLGEFNGYTTEKDGDDIVGIKVNFTDATSISANTPYIINISSEITSFTVEGVDIAPDTEPKAVVGDGEFIGSYVPTTIPAKGLFLYGDKFYYSTGSTEMKGYRAYFAFDDVLAAYSSSLPVKIKLDVDGTTALDEVKAAGSQQQAAEIYDFSGRRVEKAGKGLYIINNKKVLFK